MVEAFKKRGKRGGKKHKLIQKQQQEEQQQQQDASSSSSLIKSRNNNNDSVVPPISSTTEEENKTKKPRRGKRGGKNRKDTTNTITTTTLDEKEKNGPAENNTTTKQEYYGQEQVQQQQDDDDNEEEGVNNDYSFEKLPHLKHDLRDYFIGLEEKLDTNDFESNEDRDIFVTNIYKELDGHELEMIGDFDGSRIIEKLLPLSTDFHLRILGARLIGSYLKISCHKYASHVCQSLLHIGADVIHREQTGSSIVTIDDDNNNSNDQQQQQDEEAMQDDNNENQQQDSNALDEMPSMADIVLAICNEVMPHLSELTCDPYASHVVRVLLVVLSGKGKIGESRSNKSQKFKAHNLAGNVANSFKKNYLTPESFKSILSNVCDSIVSSLRPHDIQRLAVNPVGCGVLQVLVDINGADQPFVRTLIESSPQGGGGDDDDGRNFFTILMKDKVSSHLVERIIESMAASNKDNNDQSGDGGGSSSSNNSLLLLQESLYHKYFEGNLYSLSRDPIANFIIQKLIENSTGTILERIVKELCPQLNGLLFGNRGGVVEKLVLKCGGKERKTLQKDVFKGLCDALEISTPEDFKSIVGCMICIRPPQDFKNMTATRSSTLHGSLILQHILGYYNRDIVSQIETGFLCDAMPTDVLLTYVDHKILSRNIDALVLSKTVSRECKWDLVDKLVGHYVTLAKSPYGSHFLEKIWKVCCDFSRKKVIATELNGARKILEENRTGLIVLKKLKITQWASTGGGGSTSSGSLIDGKKRASQESVVDKKRKLFADILDEQQQQQQQPSIKKARNNNN